MSGSQLHLTCDIKSTEMNRSNLQDGSAAGQTVPHVHFHLLPRKLKGDRFSGRNDAIYPALERSECSLPSELQTMVQQQDVQPLRVDADEHRLPRSMNEMEREAEWLRSFFD